MKSLLIKNILEHPLGFEWSTQGLGMLRMYLSREVRLHVWDRSLMIPGVSAVHTRPWAFVSTVIAGCVRNIRYIESRPGNGGEQWNRVRIACGVNAQVVDPCVTVEMIEQPIEIYKAPGIYSQAHSDIHQSLPDDGTVTLVERRFKKDTEHACVYWRGAGSWVSAEPRRAVDDLVLLVTRRALDTWFS